MTRPYTYLIQWDDGTTYVGSRIANGCHPDEFFTRGGYFTSSTYVKSKIQQSGMPPVRMILAEWPSKQEAYDHETFLLECFDARNNQLFLNKHNNNFPFMDWNDPDLIGTQKEVSNRPDVKKNKSIAAKKAHSNPEVKATRVASDNDPEVKARRSAAAKARWARVGEKENQSKRQVEVASRPGEKELRSDRMKEYKRSDLCTYRPFTDDK